MIVGEIDRELLVVFSMEESSAIVYSLLYDLTKRPDHCDVELQEWRYDDHYKPVSVNLVVPSFVQEREGSQSFFSHSDSKACHCDTLHRFLIRIMIEPPSTHQHARREIIELLKTIIKFSSVDLKTLIFYKLVRSTSEICSMQHGLNEGAWSSWCGARCGLLELCT